MAVKSHFDFEGDPGTKTEPMSNPLMMLVHGRTPIVADQRKIGHLGRWDGTFRFFSNRKLILFAILEIDNVVDAFVKYNDKYIA